jgi:hypothetical protein
MGRPCPKQRVEIVMRMLGKYSGPEIAAAVGVPDKQFRNWAGKRHLSILRKRPMKTSLFVRLRDVARRQGLILEAFRLSLYRREVCGAGPDYLGDVHVRQSGCKSG